jgi:hypothetical protein
MAKPRELYSGAAPQAMSLMGQGIADAYANVGRIEGQGMAALGQGIAQGITAAAGAVADYKKMSSQVKASENFYNTMKEGGYLPPEMTKGIDTVVGGEVYKNMGTAEKAQFWGDVKGYTGNALGQYYKMQQIKAEAGAAKDRIITGAFANRAAELAGTPTPPVPAMVVPVETGAGIISTTPPVVPVQPSPVQPSTKPISPWLQYKPKQKLGGG